MCVCVCVCVCVRVCLCAFMCVRLCDRGAIRHGCKNVRDGKRPLRATQKELKMHSKLENIMNTCLTTSILIPLTLSL